MPSRAGGSGSAAGGGRNACAHIVSSTCLLQVVNQIYTKALHFHKSCTHQAAILIRLFIMQSLLLLLILCLQQAAGGPAGQAASAYQLQLQEEGAELRQQALAAQRRLYDCQQQLAKAQVGCRSPEQEGGGCLLCASKESA